MFLAKFPLNGVEICQDFLHLHIFDNSLFSVSFSTSLMFSYKNLPEVGLKSVRIFYTFGGLAGRQSNLISYNIGIPY